MHMHSFLVSTTVINRSSKYRIGNLTECRIDYNFNTMCVGCIPIHVELSLSTVDDTENLSRNRVLLESWKRPWVNIHWFHCQYLTSGFIWRLYVLPQDTTDATHPLLIDIVSSTHHSHDVSLRKIQIRVENTPAEYLWWFLSKKPKVDVLGGGV